MIIISLGSAITSFVSGGILIYAAAIIFSYLLLALFSAIGIKEYLNKNSFVKYHSILRSPLTPSVSLLAPAYNEGQTIVQNVRSLLSLNYGNYEVIIINDGSKDDSLEKLINAYDLEAVNFCVNIRILSKPIKCIYKSRNPAFAKLIVVDKVNGGKADALNAGINVSKYQLFAAIDVDCIIEEDALLKMAKPFMEEGRRKVIATGGVVRIANSCVVKDGRLMKINLPEKFLPRVQVLEYIRAFLLGRMAWSKINGLLLISGAFGMFDTEIAVAAGGYNHKTVGEDMELVVRMRRYMHDQGVDYKVAYIPDPLCWTEAPESWKILGRQRNRWTRGTAETLWLHRKLFFNPKYGVLGMLSFPYWFFFEWLAPIIEASGILFFVFLIINHQVYWKFSLLLIGVVYSFALFISIASILSEELSYHQYKRPLDMLRLIFTAMLEPIFFHPLCVYYALKGNLDLIKGNKSWGDMQRVGFTKK